ncbi:hypothetical protein AB0I72_19380 [Nocardiopsis sp. NPDC049922]|uniref:zinc finger domain-containing protein n=1 Tax=Nocardiopsis sp. NPDC049922 TaxID=3155157 RepID=UPI0033FD6692
MSDQQMLMVLAKASGFDGRHPDKAVAAAWLEAIGDLPFEDTLEAVVEHYATSTDWLKPGHLRAIVERTRAERLRSVDRMIPPADPDAADYSAQLQRMLAAVADGRTVTKALAAGARPIPAQPSAEYVAARGPDYVRRRTALAVPCPVEGCRMDVGRPCRVFGAGRRDLPTGYHPGRLEAARAVLDQEVRGT